MCERAISFHEIKEGERWENMGSREPHVTFSLPNILHENGQYSLMGSQNDKLFVGGGSRLDYLSVHMHHSR
jgi:hypothetical protein